MALRLPIAVRCPQSGHLATSWSKSTPQAAHLRSSGCPVDSGSTGMAGGYAEWAEGEQFFLYVSTNSANAAGFAKTLEPKETREGPLRAMRNHHCGSTVWRWPGGGSLVGRPLQASMVHTAGGVTLGESLEAQPVDQAGTREGREVQIGLGRFPRLLIPVNLERPDTKSGPLCCEALKLRLIDLARFGKRQQGIVHKPGSPLRW